MGCDTAYERMPTKPCICFCGCNKETHLKMICFKCMLDKHGLLDRELMEILESIKIGH